MPAAVRAIAALAREEPSDVAARAYSGETPTFGPDFLIPSPFDPRLILRIAPAVAKAACETGVATRPIEDWPAYVDRLNRFVFKSGLVMKPIFSTAKAAAAKRVMARMRLPIADVPTRRFRPDPSGARADMRATLRSQLRGTGDAIPLRRKEPRRRHPPLVVLCDISGSMARYSRMLLHFLHALTNDRDRVHTFVFGTRLTNVTRHLRQKDVDVALDGGADRADGSLLQGAQ